VARTLAQRIGAGLHHHGDGECRRGGLALGDIAGFVTVDPRNGYLDQIVVAPEAWGTPVSAALIDAARQISPAGLELLVNCDNARAIRFYEKQGFTVSGEEVNARGAPLYRMNWWGSGAGAQHSVA
jgi:putative acetyltransferase